MIRRPPRSPLFPSTPLFRSLKSRLCRQALVDYAPHGLGITARLQSSAKSADFPDRKSTRLNSSHGYISYAVFCLKKKKPHNERSLGDVRYRLLDVDLPTHTH